MLKNFVKGIADAIRRKEGSSDLISPMDFAQRIDNLQVGGGTDNSSIEYLDVSGLNAMLTTVLAGIGVNVKWDSLGSSDHYPIVIAPMGFINIPRNEDYTLNANILAVAIDITIVMYDRFFGETPISVGDFLEANSIDLASIPRLTKEQFYDTTT